MNLRLLPANFVFEDTLHKFHTFEHNCEFELQFSYKESITCNSNQNAQQKSLGLPNAYLRMELKTKERVIYSYYIDLQNELKIEDFENAIDTMKRELPFAIN